jgi:cell wall-associated NlpC family hydrolase
MMLVVLGLLGVAQAAFAASPIEQKQAEAQQVMSQIYALNASLDKADELMNLANLKLTQVKHDIAVNRRELVIAEQNLARSRRTIAKRLVTLYTRGSTSTLDVILGAQNLQQVIERIDTTSRVSSLDAQVASQVATFKADVLAHRRQLRVENAQVRQLVAQRAAQKQAIEVSLTERKTLLASISVEVQRLIAQQQAAELAAARAAQARVAEAQTQANETYAATAVGVTAATPEGASVVPPSGYSGVVGVAMSELGTPYQWAGSAPGGFDCSGLVMYAYSKMGVSLPHSSYAMWGDGASVPKDQLQPGDIVFFDGLGHVGLYIGGGEFVHAPHTGTDVQVSSLDSGSYASSYVGARRVS